MRIEDDLRLSFDRHQDLVPDAHELVPAIDAGARRRRRRRHALTTSLAAVAVAAAAAIPLAGPQVAAALRGDGFTPGLDVAVPGGTAVEGPLNILVLGLDRRPGQPASEPARADSIMVVSVPETHDRAHVVSFARDLTIPIPGHGLDKINAAYAFGGATLTKTVVERLTGVRIDGTVEVRFEGMRKLTDALGGVDLCVEQRVVSIHTRSVFDPGCHRFNGTQALDYLRQRKDLRNGSLDRDRHARQYLVAVLARAGSTDVLVNPIRLQQVLRAAGDAVVVDLGPVQTTDLVRELGDLRAADVTGTAVPVVEGNDGSLHVGPDAPALFDAWRRDDLRAWITAHPD